jgi:hypothetical protein
MLSTNKAKLLWLKRRRKQLIASGGGVGKISALHLLHPG